MRQSTVSIETFLSAQEKTSEVPEHRTDHWVYLKSIRTNKMSMIAKRTDGTIKNLGKGGPARQEYSILQLLCCRFRAKFSFFLSWHFECQESRCLAIDASVAAQCAVYLFIGNFSSVCLAQLFSLSQGNSRGQHLIKSHGTMFAMLGAVRYFRFFNRT